jgi:hypothetical protein
MGKSGVLADFLCALVAEAPALCIDQNVYAESSKMREKRCVRCGPGAVDYHPRYVGRLIAEEARRCQGTLKGFVVLSSDARDESVAE